MTFENIEFTGEDLFAEATLDGEEMGFMDQYGILAYMPFTKCTIQEDPSKLNTIDDITFKKMAHLKVGSWDLEDTVEKILDATG